MFKQNKHICHISFKLLLAVDQSMGSVGSGRTSAATCAALWRRGATSHRQGTFVIQKIGRPGRREISPTLQPHACEACLKVESGRWISLLPALSAF